MTTTLGFIIRSRRRRELYSGRPRDTLRFAFSVEYFPLTLTLSLREREQQARNRYYRLFFFDAASLPFVSVPVTFFFKSSRSLRNSRFCFCSSSTSLRRFLKSSTGLRAARRSATAFSAVVRSGLSLAAVAKFSNAAIAFRSPRVPSAPSAGSRMPLFLL